MSYGVRQRVKYLGYCIHFGHEIMRGWELFSWFEVLDKGEDTVLKIHTYFILYQSVGH